MFDSHSLENFYARFMLSSHRLFTLTEINLFTSFGLSNSRSFVVSFFESCAVWYCRRIRSNIFFVSSPQWVTVNFFLSVVGSWSFVFQLFQAVKMYVMNLTSYSQLFFSSFLGRVNQFKHLRRNFRLYN